jgi:hypothetical protein
MNAECEESINNKIALAASSLKANEREIDVNEMRRGDRKRLPRGKLFFPSMYVHINFIFLQAGSSYFSQPTFADSSGLCSFPSLALD